jgi:uncharacterized sporulation protein YeaH/YhbH (DUF444 family)
MAEFIDRRFNNKHKSTLNRQRFLQRFNKQIKKAISDAVCKRSITNIDAGEKIMIPSKDVSEPVFKHKAGGKQDTIYAGNKEFVKGDRIKKPTVEEQSTESQASNTGEGMDNFSFELSRDEFLEVFFENMALPDLVKKNLGNISMESRVRAGYTRVGAPSNINVIRTLRNAIGRRIAIKGSRDDGNENEIPFLDPLDVRYNFRTKQERPITQAVMFCVMDVSGSMDESKKEVAKRFFILLYLFLKHNYEKIELVFIRHHTAAKEVDENEFFYSRETGGTVVSSALELTKSVIRERYASNSWNIYVAQASDGDNWNADSPYCHELLSRDLLPMLQYYAYVEIMPRHHQSLWEVYQNLESKFHNFSMRAIHAQSEIFPVFQDLFKREYHE